MSIEQDILNLQARVAYLETLPGGAVSGTWTPEFVGTSTAGVYTYTFQLGYYTRFGSLVNFTAFVGISAIGTPPVGNMRISGLPYSAAATYYTAVTIGSIDRFNFTAAAMQLEAYIPPGAAVIVLEESFDNAVSVLAPAANFTNVNCHLICSGTYRAA